MGLCLNVDPQPHRFCCTTVTMWSRPADRQYKTQRWRWNCTWKPLFVFPEAHPGPPFHRVPPASLYLQREPFGHRETPQLPGQRGPELHLPGGPDMCLQRLSDQHHWMHHIRVTGGEDTYKNIYTSCTLITTQIFHDFYKNVGLNKQIKTLKEDKRDIHIIVAVIIIFRSLSAEKMWSTLDHLFGW